MKIIVILMILFAGLFFFSCKTKKSIADVPKELISPIITYSKGSCRGFCPVLKLEIYETGLVKYEGTKNVDHIGAYTITLRSDKLKQIIDKCENGGFLQMEPDYLSGFMDIPEMKVTYKGHKIRYHTRKAPKPLVELMDILDEIALNTIWKENPKM